MQKANKVEFRCEYSPKQVRLLLLCSCCCYYFHATLLLLLPQVTVWVEKDTKAKEVTPFPLPVIKKISCGPNHTVAIDENHKVGDRSCYSYFRPFSSRKILQKIQFL